MKNRFTKWILRRIFGRLTSTYSCANRVGWTYEKLVHGELFQYKIVCRQVSIPDTYSREERYAMAKILRSEFERDRWDVYSCFDSATSTK